LRDYLSRYLSRYFFPGLLIGGKLLQKVNKLSFSTLLSTLFSLPASVCCLGCWGRKLEMGRFLETFSPALIMKLFSGALLHHIGRTTSTL